jgi:hypothetical protein
VDWVFLAALAALAAGTVLLVRLCDRLAPPRQDRR